MFRYHAAAAASLIALAAPVSAQQVVTVADLDPGCAPYLSVPTPNVETAPAKITFTNARSADILVGWVDFDGNLALYDQLPPGVSYTSNSYVGHIWVMVDSTNRQCVMGTAVRNDGDHHTVN